MTGFGRGESHGEDISVTADIRTVNHRYLDVHVKAPGKFVSWESRIRSIARETLRRGKVDIFINVREWGGGGGNQDMVMGWGGNKGQGKKEGGLLTGGNNEKAREYFPGRLIRCMRALPLGAAAPAYLALPAASTILPKAAESERARSARILRSRLMAAFFKPAIRRE